MQNRINRLENLVLSLMGSGSPAMNPATAAALVAGATSPSTTTDEPSQLTPSHDNKETGAEDADLQQVERSIGVLKVHNDRQFYASEAHWWTILSDIAEVKRYFLEHQKQYDEQVEKVKIHKRGQPAAAVSLLFRGAPTTDQATLLSNFPQKPMADKLMHRHFNTDGAHMQILHAPTFRRQYDIHWDHPEHTSIPWLGMCFAMMSLALESYHRAGDEPPEFRGTSRSLAIKYSDYSAQCLVTADFTQPLDFMLEALCYYFHAEYARNVDAETGLWMLAGIITRLAMRMGLQRDSAPYASCSPFRGEMRRRVWSYIRTADILLSFQCGFPNMIRSTDTDTNLPSNIHDEEFNDSSATLPPSRSMTDNTPMTFVIAHTRMIYQLGRIQELAMSLSSPSWDATQRLDEELQEIRAQLPSLMRMESAEHSSIDPPLTIMQRLALDLTYQKSRCLLHRKFMALARKDPRYFPSRKACIEACLEMLSHQSTIQAECQPGARLSSLAWSFTTSLTTHDYLLSAMIVCLDLYHTAQAESQSQTSGEGYAWALQHREVMFNAISRAVQTWESLKDQSLEAYKASSILKVMLDKLKDHQALRQQLQNNFAYTSRNDGLPPDGLVASEHSAALTLELLSSGGRLHSEVVPSAYDPKYVQDRTAVTPQPGFGQQVLPAAASTSLADGSLINSNLFGSNIMELSAANLDWVSPIVWYARGRWLTQLLRMDGMLMFRGSGSVLAS